MPRHRSFRFGLNALSAASAADWRAKARRAEDLGYATFSVAGLVAWVREAAGARFADLELSALVFDVVVTPDRQRVAAERGAPFGHSPEQVLGSPHLLIGTTGQMAEDLRERRERYGISYVVVFEPAMDAFAPVVAQLAGT